MIIIIMDKNNYGVIKKMYENKKHNLECVSNNTFHISNGARAHIYQCKCGFNHIFYGPLFEQFAGDTDKKAEKLHLAYIKKGD